MGGCLCTCRMPLVLKRWLHSIMYLSIWLAFGPMVQNFKINKLHLQLVTSNTCLLHFALDSTLGIGLAPTPLYIKMVPMVLLQNAFDHLGLSQNMTWQAKLELPLVKESPQSTFCSYHHHHHQQRQHPQPFSFSPQVQLTCWKEICDCWVMLVALQ